MSSQLNGYLSGGIAVICIFFIFGVVMFGIFYKPPAKLQNFVSGTISYNSQILSNVLPKTKAGLFVFVTSIVLIITSLALIIVGVNNTKFSKEINRDNTTIVNPVENFGNETTTTYKAIGYGPVIDKTKVKNWLNGTSGITGLNLESDKTAWLDGNGVPISIPTDQFKSLYGYIPPSFAYYPKGQTKNDYNATNYESGRENCMKACSLTNCIAVQTEIPENCSQKSNPNETGNSCGSNAEFSCTLFYDNIKNADDAYWTMNNFSSGIGLTNSPGCFETTSTSCLGKKYYEDSAVPTELANKSIKPSQNPVPFCESSVSDPGNCVKRTLITTEYVQANHPYYSLPINASKASGAVSGNFSMLVPTKSYKNGQGTSCGVVDGKLVSCETNKACAQGESTMSSSNCWQIDTTACSGNPYDQSSGANQLQTYKNNYANAKDENGEPKQGANYDDLYPSCYYRQRLTVVQPVQFNCDSSVVTRGCWGSPPIIYTDSLTDNSDIIACSDTSVIPNSQRCQNGTNLAECAGFPYSCGTNNGSNTLWIKQ